MQARRQFKKCTYNDQTELYGGKGESANKVK